MSIKESSEEGTSSSDSVLNKEDIIDSFTVGNS